MKKNENETLIQTREFLLYFWGYVICVFFVVILFLMYFMLSVIISSILVLFCLTTDFFACIIFIYTQCMINIACVFKNNNLFLNGV